MISASASAGSGCVLRFLRVNVPLDDDDSGIKVTTDGVQAGSASAQKTSSQANHNKGGGTSFAEFCKLCLDATAVTILKQLHQLLSRRSMSLQIFSSLADEFLGARATATELLRHNRRYYRFTCFIRHVVSHNGCHVV